MRLHPLIAFAALLALLGAAAIACLALTPFALQGVQASSGGCDPQPSMETAVQSSWSGTTLRLAIDQPENCAMALQAASVQRLGSHLFVRTEYRSPSGLQTGCRCRHRTHLDIAGLPRQPFQTHVYSWP
jgi:hypothetical protein